MPRLVELSMMQISLKPVVFVFEPRTLSVCEKGDEAKGLAMFASCMGLVEKVGRSQNDPDWMSHGLKIPKSDRRNSLINLGS